VRKTLGYREVLRNIDLDVPAGMLFVIHGPNGAGKSTLLRLAATQWRPSAGEVLVLGRDARREALWVRRRVGLVLHESLLRRELTLEENLRFACDLQGLGFRAVRDRADGLLDRFGLFPRRRDLVATFSQGMAKRASIVRSLLHEPELWLLDEPFSGLDPAGQALLEGLVRDFPRAGGTVVLVTHEEERGERLANAWARIENGKVAARGPQAAAGGEPPAAWGEAKGSTKGAAAAGAAEAGRA
jgi:ABC-type multidrug transport system ATPase subunit